MSIVPVPYALVPQGRQLPEGTDLRYLLAAAIQEEAFSEVMFIPLGQYFQAAAWRSNITGFLKGPVPVFWNVAKS